MYLFIWTVGILSGLMIGYVWGHINGQKNIYPSNRKK